MFICSSERLVMRAPLLILGLFTLGASEASLGLSCLVTLIRKGGKDRLNLLTSLKVYMDWCIARGILDPQGNISY